MLPISTLIANGPYIDWFVQQKQTIPVVYLVATPYTCAISQPSCTNNALIDYMMENTFLLNTVGGWTMDPTQCL
jgi:hypothetical protein